MNKPNEKPYLMYKLGEEEGEVIDLTDKQFDNVKLGFGDYRFKPLDYALEDRKES